MTHEFCSPTWVPSFFLLVLTGVGARASANSQDPLLFPQNVTETHTSFHFTELQFILRSVILKDNIINPEYLQIEI